MEPPVRVTVAFLIRKKYGGKRMNLHQTLMLIISGLGAIAVFLLREEIMEGIRRGPWGGGSPPPPVGPLGAADPFRRKLKKIRLPE